MVAIVNESLSECLSGRISPEVAVAHCLLSGLTIGEIEAMLASCAPGAKVNAVASLLVQHAERLGALSAALARAGQEHEKGPGGEDAIARTRAMFDAAVQQSPEASVAAYSLGDPDILATATSEIVDWLSAERLLQAYDDVLDLGCGIGRIAGAIAPRVRSVLGLDVSPGMIAEATQRHGDEGNLRFAVTSGEDLGGLGDLSFDLILAVDSFPYLIQAGVVAERHVAEAARVLRRSGSLAILNLSYRPGLEVDRAEAQRWATTYGFDLLCDGNQPFHLWDGAAFLFRLR